MRNEQRSETLRRSYLINVCAQRTTNKVHQNLMCISIKLYVIQTRFYIYLLSIFTLCASVGPRYYIGVHLTVRTICWQMKCGVCKSSNSGDDTYLVLRRNSIFDTEWQNNLKCIRSMRLLVNSQEKEQVLSLPAQTFLRSTEECPRTNPKRCRNRMAKNILEHNSKRRSTDTLSNGSC